MGRRCTTCRGLHVHPATGAQTVSDLILAIRDELRVLQLVVVMQPLVGWNWRTNGGMCRREVFAGNTMRTGRCVCVR